jgi:arabinosaccharide transport system substrate-binding protein
MHFPLGKPIAAMLMIALITGLAIANRPAEVKKDATLWTFAESHVRMLTGKSRRSPSEDSPVRRFEQLTGKSLDPKIVGGRGMDIRLLSMFNNPEASTEIPDIVFLEISGLGRYFRAPADQMGLMPLNDRLKSSGWYDQIVTARFAPYTKEGKIFGVPIDLHPVTLTYRKDLWDEAGIDLQPIKTWDEFQEAALKFQDYWRARGEPNRRAIALQSASADDMTVLLLSRHVNLVDADSKAHLTDEIVVETLVKYARMTAGPRQIAGDVTTGGGGGYRDLTRGDLCAMFSPDWMVYYLTQYASGLKGKLAMRPLPIFAPGDTPTSTWGGTCVAIPKAAKDKDLSWKLLEMMVLDRQSIKFERQFSSVIPPLRGSWPGLDFPTGNELFGGQKVMDTYISLADKIPARISTPFSVYATGRLALVVHDVIIQVRKGNDANLEAYARERLREAQQDVESLINFTRSQEK